MCPPLELLRAAVRRQLLLLCQSRPLQEQWRGSTGTRSVMGGGGVNPQEGASSLSQAQSRCLRYMTAVRHQSSPLFFALEGGLRSPQHVALLKTGLRRKILISRPTPVWQGSRLTGSHSLSLMKRSDLFAFLSTIFFSVSSLFVFLITFKPFTVLGEVSKTNL